MTKEQASELCRNCGLCCYAFHNLGFVENEKEQHIVENFGGTIFKNHTGKLCFEQPCPAFDSICTVYPNHPSSCKGYACKLLELTNNNNIDFNKAKEIIKNTKKEVGIIDYLLRGLLGKRMVRVDDYFILFLEKAEKDINLKDKYRDLILHFGVYRYLQSKYFDN